MDEREPGRGGEVGAGEIAEPLRGLVRLRWLVLPTFVAIDLASDAVMRRHAPWSAAAVGAAVRYAVLVGVVGAAILPLAADVAAVGAWAVAALVADDAISLAFDPARVGAASAARWALDGGLVLTIAIVAGHLRAARARSAARLRGGSDGLGRARAEWEAAFDALKEMVFVTDRDGRVLRANRAFAHVVGARPHEIAGRKLSELLAGHPERWWSSPADGIVEVEDPLFDTLFEITSTRIADRIVRVARDVGEQRRMHARLVQADKLAAVGVLASGVAHEVNNPTAFVSSNLAELRRYVGAYEAALAELSALGMGAGQAEKVRGVLARPEVTFARREAASAIGESIEGMDRIRQLVSNLRTLVRRDPAGEPAAPVDVAEIVRAVVRTAASDLRAARARIDVRSPILVLGHRGDLGDVVLNLVVNAIQAADEGRPNEIAIEARRDGASVLVRVSDTGKGISPSHMKRLFEPFFTTKSAAEGTGLGLSLARKIVLAHGGSIDVASEMGVGSTFTVRLPALEPGEDRARQVESGAA